MCYYFNRRDSLFVFPSNIYISIVSAHAPLSIYTNTMVGCFYINTFVHSLPFLISYITHFPNELLEYYTYVHENSVYMQ